MKIYFLSSFDVVEYLDGCEFWGIFTYAQNEMLPV